MSNSTIQLYARLGRDPEGRTTASGKQMTTVSVFCDLSRGGDDEMPEWFSLAAFGKTGEVLAEHGKGDTIAVSGKLTKSKWLKDGVERSGFSVLLDCLASVRTVQPRKSAHDKPSFESLEYQSIDETWRAEGEGEEHR